MPSANLGLRLSSQEICINIGLRLGANLVSEHTCMCGSKVDTTHVRVQMDTTGCPAREALGVSRTVNNIIARSMRSVGVPAILEPTGLLRGDGKRLD